MRHDDDASTAQRVSRILDQVRRTEPPPEGEAWPEEWPPGASTAAEDDHRRDGLRIGPRWQVSAPASIAVAVLALLVAGVAVAVLLRGPASGTAVPSRSPLGSAGTATGLTDASGVTASATDPATDPATEPVTGAIGPTAGAGSFRVYVVGQVRSPGVVTLPADARVEDAVQAVGGATEKADLAVMNLARKVVDGERIVVPKPGEKVSTAEPAADPAAAAGSGAETGPAAAGSAAAPGAPVDLNTATVAELDVLPGVGPVIAGRIVAWRQENGRFTTVDDLSEVSGIGAATMAKLRPLVRV